MRFTTWALASCLTLGLMGWASDAMAGKGKPAPPPPPPPPPPAPVEPPARFWHAFSGNGDTTAGSSRLYVYGGQGGDSGSPALLGDFWFLQTDAAANWKWTPAPTGRTKPGLRDGVGLSCGAGQCVLANGRRLGMLKETWVYTEAAAAWSQLNCTRYLCPSARGFPAIAFDPGRTQHVLFGGDPGGISLQYLNDTYTFSGGRWTDRSQPAGPAARAVAAMTFAGGDVGKVVMFGGAYYTNDGDPSGYYRWAARCDMWAWNGENWSTVSYSTRSEGPPCLAFHSMVWDAATSRLVVTSGETLNAMGWEVANRDVWYFQFDANGSSGTWTKDSGTAFYSCAFNASPMALMAYDSASKKKAFFGGWENNPYVSAYANTTVCY
jgi:hypothetical protein